MSNYIIFWTQIGSIIGFISALFVLYRVLVSQKDSTIQLLKEKNTFLSEQLEMAKDAAPDRLAESMAARVHILEQELERLNLDKDRNSEEILKKEKEIKRIKSKADRLSRRLSRARELMEEFFCPKCGAAMTERQYHSDSVWVGNREIDIDHEYQAFECGYEILDGTPQGHCERSESA